MRTINSISEVDETLQQFIHRRERRQPYNLNTMRKLMLHLGQPQNLLTIVHIAGTSGKTSTAYYTAALLQQSGYRVGLTVSPHVDSVRERAQINLKTLDETTYCERFEEFINIVDDSKLDLTYFEVLIAFAFWLFAKEKVDYAVVEVGLGGLLDCTNVITNPGKTCIITDIGLDHVEILGDSLTKIAYQKAGIIHTGSTVFANKQTAEIDQVIQKTCRDKHAELYMLDGKYRANLRSLPAFQRRNLGLATAAVNHILISNNRPVLSQQMVARVSQTLIPARMETVQLNGKLVILDGSHNLQKIRALVDGLKEIHPDQRFTTIIKLKQSQITDAKDILKKLAEVSDKIVITNYTSKTKAIYKTIDSGKIYLIDDPKEAFEEALDSGANNILVTGSFYLLNHIGPHLIS